MNMNKTKHIIAFDMDGTIASLYTVDNWLPKLRAEDESPYIEATPMWDMEALREVLDTLRAAGWEIDIITWLSKNSSEAYKVKVRKAKREWLDRYGVKYDHFHGVAYGATKADSIRSRAKYGVLVDDNEAVRKGWKLGATIDPTKGDLIEQLKKLVDF